MTTARPLSPRELEILTAVGYLVMKWNYAEHCARQILRGYLSGTSIEDEDHLALSKKNAKWIEDQLRDSALPRWTGIGRPYLERLIETYAAARGHRNQIVHGIQMTADAGGANGATAFIINTMPQGNRAPMPQLIQGSDLAPLIEHFSLLAEFSQKVDVAFDNCGQRSLNKDGTFVMDPLPPLVATLAPCKYEFL